MGFVPFRPAREFPMPARRFPVARSLAVAALLGAGFAAGRLSQASPASPAAAAQPPGVSEMDEATASRIKEGFDSLRRAQVALEQSGRYVPAATGVNAFITLAGGYDVLGSLQNGRGVDPETYAALEAGFAPQNVLTDLGRDADGRLTYKDQLIRLMSHETLRSLYLRRAETLGEAL